jgi:hypothetical protein
MPIPYVHVSNLPVTSGQMVLLGRSDYSAGISTAPGARAAASVRFLGTAPRDGTVIHAEIRTPNRPPIRGSFVYQRYGAIVPWHSLASPGARIAAAQRPRLPFHGIGNYVPEDSGDW